MKQGEVYDTITLSTKEKIPLVMPRVGDILPSLIAGTVQSWVQLTIEVTTGKTWEWFLGLPLIDGTSIMKACNPSLKAVNEMILQIGSITNTATKH